MQKNQHAIKINKEKILQKAKEYQEKNKERIKEYTKHRYYKLNEDEKSILNEYRKAWYHKLDEERKNKMRKYVREYAKNKQHNLLTDCNWTRTQNHLVLKRTIKHLAKLAK